VGWGVFVGGTSVAVGNGVSVSGISVGVEDGGISVGVSPGDEEVCVSGAKVTPELQALAIITNNTMIVIIRTGLAGIAFILLSTLLLRQDCTL
jgi:hypothetical protein